MYQVLIAVDEESERAMELAEAVTNLAETTDELKAIVLYVVRDIQVPPQVSLHQPSDDYEELLDELRETPMTIRETIEHLNTAGAKAELRIEKGDPAQTIIKQAEELGVDNVYIGGRTRSPTGKAIFGSVTQEVLLNTDLPVTVVGSNTA